jgi:O-antigen/teichoic acid export membrane protein
VLGAPKDPELVAFSWPQGLTETLNFLLARVDIIMVGAFFPERPEFIAFYGMASLIAGIVKKIRNSFDNSFSPLIADLHARGDHESLRENYRKVGRWILTLFVLGGFAIALSSQFILGIYGEEYVTYWLAVPILIGGRFFNAAGGTAQAALLMAGRSKLELANNVLINLANVGLNLLLIPKYHVFGAALATSISLTVFNLARIVEVAVLLRIWVSGTQALRITLSGLIAAAPGIALLSSTQSPLWSLAGALCFVAIYPFVLYLFGNREDLRVAKRTLLERLGKRG